MGTVEASTGVAVITICLDPTSYEAISYFIAGMPGSVARGRPGTPSRRCRCGLAKPATRPRSRTRCFPGVPASSSAREAETGYYLRSLALVAGRVGLPPIAPWILADFAPEAIPADDPAVAGATPASTASASSASPARRSPRRPSCGRSSLAAN